MNKIKRGQPVVLVENLTVTHSDNFREWSKSSYFGAGCMAIVIGFVKRESQSDLVTIRFDNGFSWAVDPAMLKSTDDFKNLDLVMNAGAPIAIATEHANPSISRHTPVRVIEYEKRNQRKIVPYPAPMELDPDGKVSPHAQLANYHVVNIEWTIYDTSDTNTARVAVYYWIVMDVVFIAYLPK